MPSKDLRNYFSLFIPLVCNFYLYIFRSNQKLTREKKMRLRAYTETKRYSLWFSKKVLSGRQFWEPYLRTLLRTFLRTFWEPFSCNFHHQKGSQLLKKVLLKVLKKGSLWETVLRTLCNKEVILRTILRTILWTLKVLIQQEMYSFRFSILCVLTTMAQLIIMTILMHTNNEID